jgi:hypothetical protein
MEVSSSSSLSSASLLCVACIRCESGAIDGTFIVLEEEEDVPAARSASSVSRAGIIVDTEDMV